MVGILHWVRHVLRLNMREGELGKVDGHAYWGIRCLECQHWEPVRHSPFCGCGWVDEDWPLPKKRQR
jgi:hypothetical protein